jgi:hypothetical protein
VTPSPKLTAARLTFKTLKSAKATAGLPCFFMVRNEIYFLPHLLRHYRSLGVGHFIVHDDCSDDGSREFLLAQPDCTLVTSKHGFRDAVGDGIVFHHAARTAIPDHFVKAGWCLTVDADEFLLLPRRFPSLPALIDELDRRGEEAVLAAMVDFYPERLSERNYAFERGPFEGCRWWFDPDRTFEAIPGTSRFRILEAGFRARLISLLRRQHPDILDTIYPEGPVYPALWKVPLIKMGVGIHRFSAHSVNRRVVAGIQLALAHFKLHPATDRRIREALEWNTYAHGSVEYRLLKAAIECLGDQDLVTERSVQFHSAESLEEAGLLFG